MSKGNCVGVSFMSQGNCVGVLTRCGCVVCVAMLLCGCVDEVWVCRLCREVIVWM